MTGPHVPQVAALVAAVDAAAAAAGPLLCARNETEARLLLLWLDFLQKYSLTGTADTLLAGCRSAIVECTACLSIGLVRPALFSLRAQIDLLLCWIYFKDHLVEWQFLDRSGEGFKLKTEVLKFLDTHCDGFSEKLGVLRQAKTRRDDDPYRLLSAHVHSQSTKVVPSLSKLSDVVAGKPLCEEVCELQGACAEYLNDILLCIYASKWSSLPQEIVATARSRLNASQEKVVFA